MTNKDFWKQRLVLVVILICVLTNGCASLRIPTISGARAVAADRYLLGVTGTTTGVISEGWQRQVPTDTGITGRQQPPSPDELELLANELRQGTQELNALV